MSSMYLLSFCPVFRGFISELEFLGRKKSLSIGFFGAFFFSFCCVIDESNLNFYAGSLHFFINISLGLITVYLSEVYPTHMRGGAIGLGEAVSRLGGMFSPFLCDFMEKKIPKGSFYLFMLFGIVSMFLSCLLSRETRGRELDTRNKEEVKRAE